MGKSVKNGKKIGNSKSYTKIKNGVSEKESENIIEKKDWRYITFVTFIALFLGYLHSCHVSNLFENQRFFSHLSTLERELSFRTEMGLYYSYYKTIAEAPSFASGLSDIIKCNLTEYPDTINVLRRFNLYPEVVLGGLYRIYHWYGKTFNKVLKDCYTINRGNEQEPVESCVGMGDLAHFYVFPIFWMSGLMIFCLFILATYVSGSVLGGVLTVAGYFYNHSEATRVMWTPPLRESFSFPLLVFQILSVVHALKCSRPSFKNTLLISFTTACFMLPWQFAQFALLTQVCALFGLYMTQFITSKRLSLILYGLLIAHFINFVLQLGNTLLISSFFMATGIASLIITKLEKLLDYLSNRILIMVCQAVIFITISIGIKVGLGSFFQIKDDAHIFDILRSKFTSYKDFHTLLYVCAPEFDFIGLEYPQNIAKTFLLPVAALSTITVVYKILANEWKHFTTKEEEEEGTKLADKNIDFTKPYAVHLYLIVQAAAFLLMAILIMRLKLFSTPALCILTCFLASRKVFSFIKKKEHHYALVFLVLGLMSVKGYANLKVQFNMRNEYSNPSLEGLVEWINANTKPDDVFAGAMPTMAAIKLSCKRPIVNHPHYEDAKLRERTKRVYQVYSRKSSNYVYSELEDMNATYLILENSWCVRRTRPGCALPEIWDNEDNKNHGKEPCCTILDRDPRPFKLTYKNDVYTLLKLD